MARQSGIISIEGTIGNITFFKSKDGYMVRQKGGITAEKIANDPAFQRTRENGAEFGRASKAAKFLRSALRILLQTAKDSRTSSRLTAQFLKVIQMDQTNTRGQRNVIDGETVLVEGFEFNKGGKLGTTLFAPYVATIDRVTGELKVELQSFDPATGITVPPGATHFKLRAGGAEVHFEGNHYTSDFSETGYLPLNAPTGVISLKNDVTPASTHPLFLAMGIEFVQEVNGDMYPLKNGVYNASKVVKVDAP